MITVQLHPTAPQHLVDQLDACLRMANLLQVKADLFNLSFTVAGFTEPDLDWNRSAPTRGSPCPTTGP